jgi:two-component system, NarL family, sensor histidine kinase BarA
MSGGPSDAKLPRLLSLSVHEFRTPLTVGAGYIRMLLGERAGALNDIQRKYLQEIEKACGRLSTLVAEMSDLSKLEDGRATLDRGRVELTALLSEVIAELPPASDRELIVELLEGDEAIVQADATRLRSAFTSLLVGLRRELVTSERLLVRCTTRSKNERPVSWIAVGDAENLDRMQEAETSALAAFNDWRGGCGLSLQVARRIFTAHDGSIWSPSDEATKTAAVVVLPIAR